MIKYLTIIAMTVILAACGGSSDYYKAEDAQDAGRQFIRASLDGNYEKAKFYLLKDDDNLTLLRKQQINYQQLSKEDKRSFADANINPIAITPINDSTTTYKYHNSFHTTDTTTIRIIKVNNEWLVDLKSVIKM
jgi:hypothetical protein